MRLIDGVDLLVDYIDSRCFLLHVQVRFEGSRSKGLEAMLAVNAIKKPLHQDARRSQASHLLPPPCFAHSIVGVGRLLYGCGKDSDCVSAQGQ